MAMMMVTIVMLVVAVTTVDNHGDGCGDGHDSYGGDGHDGGGGQSYDMFQMF